MNLTDSLVQVTLWVETLLDDRKAQLGLKDVYYGDQNKVPFTPVACVEPGRKRRVMEGAPRQGRMTMEVIILVYLLKIGDIQATRKEVDAVAELIETELHKDAQMDGLAIHSFVSELESGYAYRGSSLYRTARITFEVDSKVGLPLSQGGA